MIMNRKRIVVSSRALGFRMKVPFYIYDDVEELRTAARRFSGGEIDDDCIGVCQAYVDDDGYVSGVLVRLWRKRLSTQVVSHEVHHATTALYGSACREVDPQLHHANEPFAHLFSDILGKLVDRLYALGYYPSQ